MSTGRRFLKNTGASFLTQISTPASSFVLVFFIARFLGVSGLGIFASALSLFYIFQAFSSLGFQYLITREVAQDKSKASALLVNGFFLSFVFSILMAGFMCLVINMITDTADTIQAAYVLSLALVPYSLGLVCQSICRAYERFEYITISQITGDSIKVLLGLFILFKGYGLVTLMMVILGSYFLIFLMNFFFVLKCLPKTSFKIDFGICKWIIIASPVFALIFILNTIRWNIDTLILTNMMGEGEVGYYSAATKLMNILKLGISCYIMAAQPIIFRLFKSSFEKFEIVCRESIRYLSMFIIPIVVGTAILSDKFILLIFKADFLPAANVLSIIVWILVLSGVNLIFANALIASNNQKINLIGNFINMIVNILLNLLLIPRISFIGAGIASLVSSFTLLCFQYYFISKRLFKINFVNIVKKPVIAVVVMGVVVFFFKDINIFVLIPISAMIYFLGLFVLKTFTSNDIDFLRKLWKAEKDLDLTERGTEI